MSIGRTGRWLGSGIAAVSVAAATVAWAPATDRTAPVPEVQLNSDPMACDLEIIVTNNGTKTVQLYLYTSEMRVNSWTVPALFRNFKQMQIQNARVEPGKTYRGKFNNAKGGCNVRRSWRIRYRVTGVGEYWAYLPDTKSRFVKWPGLKSWSNYHL